MRNAIPILNLSSYTPKYSDVGLYLNASRFHGGIETTAVWLHGILILEASNFSPATEQSWLEALNLVAVSESNQLPIIAKIVGDRTLIQEHSSEAKLNDGRPIRLLPFTFNLKDILGRGLYDDNYYIHLSARQYSSTPVRIVKDDVSLPGYLEQLETTDQNFEAADKLIQAYDFYSAGKLIKAVEYFSDALKNGEIRNDIDCSNLNNAATCAGQAALEAAPEVAEKLLGKTTEWMSEDLQIRNNVLLQIQKLLIAQENKQNDRLEKRRTQLLSDLGVINVST